MEFASSHSVWPSGSGEVARLVRERDWTGTALGPVSDWPYALRIAFDIALGVQTPIGIYWGPDFNLVYNDAFVQLIGNRHPAALGQPARLIYPELWDVLKPLFEGVFTSGQPASSVDALMPLMRDGRLEDRWFDYSLNPIRDADGRVEGIFNIATESTARILAERRQAFVLELTDALRPLSDASEIMRSGAEALGRFLGAGRCAYALVGPDERLLAGGLWPDGDAPDGWIGGLTVARGHFAANGPEGMISVRPVMEEGRVVAAMVVADAGRCLSDAETGLAEEAGARIHAAVKRALAERALRESEQRYRAIIETAHDYAIFTTDAQGIIETWPPGAETVFGWQAAEVIGKSLDLTFTPEDVAAGAPDMEREIARGAGVAPNVRWHVRRDGRRVFIDGVMRPLTAPSGALAGFVKVGQDVSDRRRAEEQLQLATEAARLGIFDVDLATGSIAWDARLRDIWGVGPDEVITDDLFISAVPAEERDTVRAAVVAALDPAGNHLYQAEYRVQPPGGELRWIAAQGRVHFDGATPVRLVGTVQEITERKRVEAALQESEERFRAMAEQALVGVCLVDRAQRFIFANPAFARIVGRPVEEIAGLTIRDLTAPADWPENSVSMQDVLTDGAPFVVEKRYARPDGSRVWVRNSVSPRRDCTGAIIGGIAISIDVSDRHAAEEALQQSERRFRQFGEASADALWIRDAKTLLLEYINPACRTIFGMDQDDLGRKDQFRRRMASIHVADRKAVLDSVRRLRAGEVNTVTYRVTRPGDGAIRWIRSTSFPLRNGNGVVSRIGGISHDATEEVQVRERLNVLVQELHHRTRNLIAVVGSIATQTMAQTGPSKAFLRKFEDRLAALSRVQGLVSRGTGDAIVLSDLLDLELDALAAMPGERVRLSGPVVRLRPAVVQAVALVIHELATNARKYGALSHPDGRLDVQWALRSIEGRTSVVLEWIESGPAFVGLTGFQKAHRGYGRQLIEQALPYSHGAITTYRLDETGLRCTIDLPLES